MMPDQLRDIVIRGLEPEDYEGMAALSNLPECQRQTLQLPFRTRHEARTRLAEPDLNSYGLAAVTSEAKIVGIASVYVLSRPRRRHTGQLGMMVHDDYHGRGIGSALLGALINQSENWIGITRLELTVFTDNARAIALYRRFGFEIEGTFRRYALRDGGYVDAHSMARLKDAEP